MLPMEKKLILHGHFYQPPRENPYCNIITEQDVHPYHDWNERITAECYQPNAHSRILDGVGRITKVVNNYEYLSFNFGPTLLDYLAAHFPETVTRIVAADRASIARTGHGNAMAQVFNHIILPLARYEDMISEIRWGIFNFERHFGRTPEGMWLSETAINRDVVDALWQCGIRFTVLSPYQASAVISNGQATQVSDGTIDTSKPYLLKGHRGGEIAVFFYHPELARGIAFEHALRDAHGFAKLIDDAFKHKGLVNIATDGESYGHHEPFADMCIAKYFSDIIPERGITVTNYAAVLAAAPPTEEVLLHDGANGSGTSWSCSHGVERWRSDCGCATGSHDGWNQRWRGPLRAAVDILRDAHEEAVDMVMPLSAEDKRVLRDAAIAAAYDRKVIHALHEKFAKKVSLETFTEIMDSYRYALYAYTSCGWFFADITGLEPVQNLKYADIAFELLASATGKAPYILSARARFIHALGDAKSNIPGMDGNTCYERWVIPERYPAEKIVYHQCAEHISHGLDIRKIPDSTLYGNSVRFIKHDRDKIVALSCSPSGRETRVTLSIRPTDALAAAAATDAGTVSLSLRDIVYDERKRISRRLTLPETSKLLSAGRSAFETSLRIIRTAHSHGVPPPREMMQLFSAFFALKLETLAENGGFRVGQYAEIESLLAIAKENTIVLDTRSFAERVEKDIRKHCREMLRHFDPAIASVVIADMHFVNKISLPVRRSILENDVYAIIERYRRDRTLTIAAQSSLIMLGQWFNFNMDAIAK